MVIELVNDSSGRGVSLVCRQASKASRAAADVLEGRRHVLSLHGPEEVPAYVEPVLRPNLNRGRVPDTAADLLKKGMGKKDEAQP